MKSSIKYICYISVVILTTWMTSCKKLTEVNLNPNEASTTHPQALLTKVQWDAFRAWGGTGPLYAVKMLVQTDGINDNQIFNWQRGVFDQYENLRNVVKMQEEAEAIGSVEYDALAKFFRAYYFYTLSLSFGDIPYSEAALGEKESIFEPKYDKQEDVFAGVLQELEEANNLLKNSSSIISGDIIYGGDGTKWRKLINSFRLKVLMTLSNKVGASKIDVKASFANIYANEPIFSDINGTDDAKLVFLNQDGNRYPEFNSSGYGSGMYMDMTFIERLKDHKDPRLFAVATQTRVGKEAGKALNDFTAYEGGDPTVPYAEVNEKAVQGRLSKVHERFTEDPTTEPLVLMGNAELQLILAEAILKGWITGDLNKTYENGIRSSFKFYETYAKGMAAYFSNDEVEAYLAQPIVSLATATSDSEKLQKIMMQKYFRTFQQGGWSAYMDHLRTGFPTFKKNANVKVAYRWMYPQKEYNDNTANVSAAIQSQFNGDDNINLQPWWVK